MSLDILNKIFIAFFSFLTKIFGSQNQRELKRIQPIVDDINSFEPAIKAMSDEALKSQTQRFKQRLQQGETLEDILPEAFATVREASIRALNMRHFDCQLIGGIALHQGKIAEMKTGEGKTLVATLPAYLNALTEKGVHIITVNDYLAKRDAQWMGKIYQFLGLSVGVIVHGLDDMQRKQAYACDIIYGTNNEFGFDYLRDNMKFSFDYIVQRDLYYAIVDEVDSILIDEARTPLIISGPAEKSTGLYYQVDQIIPKLTKENDFTIDEKARSVTLTEQGVAHVENLLKVTNLYDPKHIELLHHVNQALKAHTLFKRDVDYIVENGEVIIVDEFTGRLMPGRRYSEGLHQALEAKEHVKIENENQTLATITFQNYFRMYEKLAGMTGTAETEAAEFKKIYNLDVLVVPTNMDMIRIDYPDVIYKTKKEKFTAVIQEIEMLHEKGQPILVGTINIDVSEMLSEMLQKRGIPHNVLNAKNHSREAEIVAMAGQKGMVTISTNMAGRGTDIVLGEGVKEIGGLHILGTERHESRRIDNQLRGRSGRQGDLGSSRFYLSLEDDLLRIFGGERISSIMERFGMPDGEAIEHNLVSRAIENAQRRVEAHNFEIRKHLLDYDDVMNQQREVIYRQRREALSKTDLRDSIVEMITEQIDIIVNSFGFDASHPESPNTNSLNESVFNQFNHQLALTYKKVFDFNNDDDLYDYIYDQIIEKYSAKENEITEKPLRSLERHVVLNTVDTFWKDHLLNMDHLKEGIGLRGYAQQNPLIVYKKEGFEMFQSLISRIKEEILRILFRIEIRVNEHVEEPVQPKEQKFFFSHGNEDSKPETIRRNDKKTGRNDLCPCGSGKKFKRCCMK
ncbi:MAG: preprotein translocase subunit SecA [Desulfobacterales bacterium]|nr:preprotein translocase subunit SecA [Desulfobacterales bacterium]